MILYSGRNSKVGGSKQSNIPLCCKVPVRIPADGLPHKILRHTKMLGQFPNFRIPVFLGGMKLLSLIHI